MEEVFSDQEAEQGSEPQRKGPAPEVDSKVIPPRSLRHNQIFALVNSKLIPKPIHLNEAVMVYTRCHLEKSRSLTR